MNVEALITSVDIILAAWLVKLVVLTVIVDAKSVMVWRSVLGSASLVDKVEIVSSVVTDYRFVPN